MQRARPDNDLVVFRGVFDAENGDDVLRQWKSLSRSDGLLMSTYSTLVGFLCVSEPFLGHYDLSRTIKKCYIND
jgi:hypothetical protein